ncbi:MAG TPA: hypothetical protein VFN67_43085 [Polyangiales bacterium]|nr:hypothetical protein [Polyangiales bacterium]
MPVQLLAVIAAVLALASCYPDRKCSGELVFDDATALCYECPKGSTYKDQTCECGEGYEFIGLKCVLMDGAMPPIKDAGKESDADVDAKAYAGHTCAEYCGFQKACIGMNALAPAVLSDIVTGLHANDSAACESACKADLGDKEAMDEAVSCIVEAQPNAMCDAADPQAGLAGAFGAIGTCCEPRKDNPLCKSICKPLKANPLTSSMVAFCD